MEILELSVKKFWWKSRDDLGAIFDKIVCYLPTKGGHFFRTRVLPEPLSNKNVTLLTIFNSINIMIRHNHNVFIILIGDRIKYYKKKRKKNTFK